MLQLAAKGIVRPELQEKDLHEEKNVVKSVSHAAGWRTKSCGLTWR